MRCFDKLYTSGKNTYRGTTIRALDISGSGHIGETILDISGRDASGEKNRHIGKRHIGEIKVDLSGKDISGKYLEKSEVENIIYIFEYDKKKFGDVCVLLVIHR